MPSEQYSQPQHGRSDQYGQQQTANGRQPRDRLMSGQSSSDQQMGGQSMSGQQAQPHSFKDHMSDELRIVLEDFGELSHVAAYCATACASGGPELGTCARVCQDIAEIADLNEMLVARDSMFGPEVADMFLRVAAEGLPTLRRHEHHPHVVETIATLERTMNSCETVLQQVRQGSRMGHRGTGIQTSARQQSDQRMQGTSAQGRHAQGTSGRSITGSETTGQPY